MTYKRARIIGPAVGLITSLALSGCAATGTFLTLGTNEDESLHGEYTAAQSDIYRDAVIAETRKGADEVGLSVSFGPTDDEVLWEPYETRAKALCDDALTRGWVKARASFGEPLLAETMANLPPEMQGTSESQMRVLMQPIVDGQLNAVRVAGSFCPDLQ